MRRSGAVLRVKAAQRCIAVARWRNRARDDPLSFTVTFHSRAKLLDHPDWLVANREALGDGVLAFQNVHVGAADGRRRDAHKRVERPDIRDRLVLQNDAPRLYEDSRFHVCHDSSFRTLI